MATAARGPIGPHEQEVPRGQQDAPWLRRRGSKNSRKLLYFVEWAQECKMSAAFSFSFFLPLSAVTLGSEWYHMSGATHFEDRRDLVRCMCDTRMFAVTHLHILLWKTAPSAADPSGGSVALASCQRVRWTDKPEKYT
ncbi:uncharacterized protein V6R79_025303 [Siganus canaliculatus]